MLLALPSFGFWLVKLVLPSRGTGGDRDPRRWENRKTIPNATLASPE